MKKTLFSLAFVAMFGFYAVSQHTNSSISAIAIAPHKKTTTAVVAKTVAKTSSTPAATGLYKNGTYVGSVADAYYGNVQVQVTTKNGKIVDVQFLDYPHDRSTSVQINSYATPILAQEAIQAQSASVNAVSGASHTSGAFVQSLASALSQARA